MIFVAAGTTLCLRFCTLGVESMDKSSFKLIFSHFGQTLTEDPLDLGQTRTTCANRIISQGMLTLISERKETLKVLRDKLLLVNVLV